MVSARRVWYGNHHFNCFGGRKHSACNESAYWNRIKGDHPNLVSDRYHLRSDGVWQPRSIPHRLAAGIEGIYGSKMGGCAIYSFEKIQSAIFATLTAALCLFWTGSATAQTTLSATSLAYGSETVGTASASQSVTLTNTGTAALAITSIAVTGADASSFVFANSCGTSVAVGASCTIHGHFTPAATGALTAAIKITDNAGGSPQSIALTGTGH